MNSEEFAAHPLWSTSDAVETAVTQVESLEGFAQVEDANRVRFVVSQAQGHREPPDPALYSRTALDLAAQQMEQVLTSLNQVIASGDSTALSTSSLAAEAVLQTLGCFPVEVPKGGAVAAANRAFAAYREAAEKAQGDLVVANGELRSKLKDQQKDHDDAVVLLEGRLVEATQQIPSEIARLSKQITDQNETFNTKQTERELAFNAWLAKQGEDLSGLAAADLTSIKERLAEANTSLEAIGKLRDDTEKVAEIATGDQGARGYRVVAESRWKWAIAFYCVGFLFLAGGGLAIFWVFQSIEPNTEISWPFTVLRVALTGSLVFAAVIAFQLGGRLLNESRVSKQFELELKAIGPLFPAEEDRAVLLSVKKDLVQRSFGNAWSGSTSAGSQDLPQDKEIAGLIGVVKDLISKYPNNT